MYHQYHWFNLFPSCLYWQIWSDSIAVSPFTNNETEMLSRYYLPDNIGFGARPPRLNIPMAGQPGANIVQTRCNTEVISCLVRVPNLYFGSILTNHFLHDIWMAYGSPWPSWISKPINSATMLSNVKTMIMMMLPRPLLSISFGTHFLAEPEPPSISFCSVWQFFSLIFFILNY